MLSRAYIVVINERRLKTTTECHITTTMLAQLSATESKIPSKAQHIFVALNIGYGGVELYLDILEDAKDHVGRTNAKKSLHREIRVREIERV